jgi:predicted AAA+ superfamily ATPase
VTELNEQIATDILAVFAGEEPEGYVDPDADWL